MLRASRQAARASSRRVTQRALGTSVSRLTPTFRHRPSLQCSSQPSSSLRGCNPIQIRSHSSTSAPDAIATGKYEGSISVGGGTTMRLVFRADFTDGAEILMDSPDQMSFGTRCNYQQGECVESPLTPSHVPEGDGPLVGFVVPGVGRFVGRCLGETTLAGQWEQAGQIFGLQLERLGEALTVDGPERPQMPIEPLPYDVMEVSIPNPAAPNVVLSGTLRVPLGASTKPGPGVVLLAGSGPHSRVQSVFGHETFTVLGHHLALKGITVLSCDKRGVGSSTGDFVSSSPEEFASDALAGAKYLDDHECVASNSVGLIGHSEGALTATLAHLTAPTPSLVSFLVLMGGMAMPGHELLVEQNYHALEAEGVPGDLCELARSANAKMFAAGADSSLDEAALEAVILAARKEMRSAIPTEAHAMFGLAGVDVEETEKLDETMVQTLNSHQLRWLLAHDPEATLREVTVPTLAINGGKDCQVPPSNLDRTERALQVNSPLVEVRLFPDCNHLFQTCPPESKGAVSEYGKLEETFSPEAMDCVADFVLAQSATTD